MTDEQAIARYRYMLKTAPPETIEQAHAEAFAQLTPEQRQMVLQELSKNLPEHERRAAQYGDDPQSLARMATRAEMRQPGTMERTFGGMGGGGYGMGGGIGLGGLMAGSFLSSFAGMMLGSMIAQSFFNNDHGYSDGYADGYAQGDQNADTTDAGNADVSQDAQGADYASGDQYTSGDMGGYDSGTADYGSSGGWGDLGGGDFGGGDFGGGDFGF
jgi:hypothetical protein